MRLVKYECKIFNLLDILSAVTKFTFEINYNLIIIMN